MNDTNIITNVNCSTATITPCSQVSKRKLYCRFCLIDLWHEHTFIKCVTESCAKFGVTICLPCFASGNEDDVHKNTDPYHVLCNAVKINDCLWSAHEEIILLDTFMDTMSWEKVGQKFGISANECESHYFNNFVLHPKIKGLEYINKNAFRFNKFNEEIEERTKSINNLLDSEGIYLFKIFFQPIYLAEIN